MDEGFHLLQKGDKARGLLVGAGVKPSQRAKILFPEAPIMLHLHANAIIRRFIGSVINNDFGKQCKLPKRN